MKKKVLLILSCLFLSIGFIMAQTTRATGTVVDSNGEPVISASVVVKGTTVGTVTDIDGNFSVNVPDGKNTLVFTLIGMKSVEARASENMKIVMEEDTHALTEVVLEVPYGVAKKESFTGSAEVISNTKITKRPVANVTKAIEGQVTGIRTTSGTGQPGEGATIRIRGVGSINASSDPLYVVDGAPYDGSISAINPNDIATITVLKDAAAGALYGARGANGVIMITTRKGEAGKLQVNLKANWGVSSRFIPRYETMDEREYIQSIFYSLRGGDVSEAAGRKAINAMFSDAANRVFGENGQYFPFKVPEGSSAQGMIDPLTGLVDPSAQLRYSDDWLGHVTASNPLRQEYNLTASGGNEKNKYMFSLGYLSENGLLETTKFERFSGRLGVDSELHKWVRAGLNVNFAKNTSNMSNTSGSASSNVFYSAQLIAPVYPIWERNADGSFVIDDLTGDRVFDYGDNRASGASQGFNSVATLYDDKYGSESDNFSGRTYVELGNFKGTALDGLKLTTNLSVDYQGGASMTYYNPYFGNSEAVKGTLAKSNARLFSYTFNQLLYYDKDINEDHHISAMVGHEFYRRDYSYLGATKTGFPFGGIHELDAATNISSASSYKDKHTIESVLSSVNYDYKDKYYLSASLRSDASSRFHKDDRWGTFWSAGASWRISQEDFLKDKEWLDNMTIKASYGLQGNDAVGSYYAWQAFYDLTWSNATQSGALASSLENKELKWEKNANLNVGVEARFLNRLNASIEYFSRKTTDLLLHYPMAPSTGFDGYYRNVGEMKNYGWDIMVGADIVRTNDFNWNLTLMGTYLKNEVTSLSTRPDITGTNTIVRVGEAINSFYVAESAGVDPATGNQLFWVYDTVDGKKGERYVSSSTSKASASRDVHGSRFPDFEGSINNEFRYKDFDLSVLCTYSLGGEILDGAYLGLLRPTYVGQAAHVNRADAWVKPGDITDIPRLVVNKTYVTTTDDLIDASYFAIKNISLGYNIPKTLISKTGLGAIRFTATADNVVLFNHMKGMNNQSSLAGTNSIGVYVPSRTISFGVDIKF
ncbi:TonB-dependent receptor [Dysgonomonas sp. Marseille-P4361]|uniref:SusC/RagA family TonB-linked outer membrane protein n=1 Tax=Dysgonomonas sp. Marseille-P4361 TaxID=2161820 RepID=UPI000D551D18|nr:TonB-dependent receptor [Dysgonomonas sp. Marseille-P4361]